MNKVRNMSPFAIDLDSKIVLVVTNKQIICDIFFTQRNIVKNMNALYRIPQIILGGDCNT